jgi:hypothetical protein
MVDRAWIKGLRPPKNEQSVNRVYVGCKNGGNSDAAQGARNFRLQIYLIFENWLDIELSSHYIS